MNDTLVTIVTVIFVGLAPVAAIGAIFLWGLYRDDVRESPGRRVRLSLIMALTGSIAALAATELAIASAFRIAGYREIVAALTPITLGALVALDFIPLLNAGYLRWIRGRRFEREGKRRPPPFGDDD